MEKPTPQELEFRIKELEEQLGFVKKKAQIAREAKIEFMANMSHELRTPMHAIINYARFGITRHQTLERDKLGHYFSQIQEAASRMMDLLSNLLLLLDYDAGLNKLQLASQDIARIARQAVDDLEPLIKQKQLVLIVIEHPGVKPVVCDRLQICEVFKHLLSNAVKYSPGGKRVVVEIQPAFTSKRAEQEPNREPTAVQVTIADQGVGIPETETRFLFKRFTQSSRTNTGAGGTGLGLAICNEIIQAHGGRIWAKNGAEGGATFGFSLPYLQV